MYSPKRQFGNLGEDLAIKDLESKGFEIKTRNYLKKWGEIDIVAFRPDTRGGRLHFIEVKTVTFIENSPFRPEDNVHYDKLRRLARTIDTFLLEHKKEYRETDWQIDVACVYIERDALKKIEYIENVIV